MFFFSTTHTQTGAMSEMVRIAEAVKPKSLNKHAKVKMAQDLLAETQVSVCVCVCVNACM